ncbi:MAG: hypothetical protein AAB525_01415 [Patescibacteria group bacterium]
MQKIELIILQSEEKYRQEYLKTYVSANFYLIDIPVIFSAQDFDHIFFEPSKEGTEYIFSPRRAKRMYFIKAILSEKLNIEMMYEPDRETIALFCLDLECVMYLRIRPGTGSLQVGTFFDFGRDHTKMYLKQKKKCVPITLQEIKKNLILKAVSLGPTA